MLQTEKTKIRKKNLYKNPTNLYNKLLKEYNSIADEEKERDKKYGIKLKSYRH